MEIIPKHEIIKIFRYDSAGKKKEVYVFQGSESAAYELNELFSEIELEEIEIYKIKVIYSKQQIHKDDSIRILKKKIVNEMGLTYDEIYMFSYVQEKINILRLYQEITSNEKYDFTHAMFLQVLRNLGLQPTIINEFNRKEVYNYDDLMGFGLHERLLDVPVSVGQKFTRTMNFLFSACPFHLTQDATSLYKMNPENPLVEFENQLLFYFGNFYRNTIYLCTAPELFDYALGHHIQEEFISQTYYPLLFNNDITKKSAFVENRAELLTLVQTKTLKLYDTIDMFYNIFYTKKLEIPYLNRGITYFDIIIHPNSKTIMPLEAIFKNIHATQTCPFIKYNPGSRKENIYRLYSLQTNKVGKKIPFLSKNLIMNLSKNTGKSKQLSLFKQCIYDSALHDFFVDFDYNGDIHLRCELTKAIDKDQVFDFIVQHFNPTIRTMNQFLDKTGYTLDEFVSFELPNIEFVNLRYKIILEKVKDVNIKEKAGCLTSIFDIIDDSSPEKTVLRYKRVSNFQKMDSMNALINEIYSQTNNERAVVERLMQNYQLSENDALVHISKFLNAHTRIQGAFVNKEFSIAENPGFETVIRIMPFEKQIVVDIDNINAIDYIDALSIYMDSFIRMIQYPESIKVSAAKIKQMCSRTDFGEDVAVKNMIVPNTMSSVQPLTFGKNLLLLGEDDFTEEEEEDQGLILEDYADNDDDEGLIPEEETDYEPTLENTVHSDVKTQDKPVNTTEILIDERPKEDEDEDEGLIFDEFEGGAPVDGSMLDGKPFKKKDIFFNKMKRLEPKIFGVKSDGNFGSYAQLCGSNYNKQPVILTQAEKDEIDKNHPGSYENSVKYGTDSNNPYYYICPRFWCLLTNTSITEEEVQSGKCGTIIPKDAKTIPRGAYVYEFTDDKYHKNKEGEYITHHPGFREAGSNKDGHCVPCCYSNWNSDIRKTRRQQCENPEAQIEPEVNNKAQNVLYIVGFDKYLKQFRFGFLPPAVERFFSINHSKIITKNNPALIKTNTPVLLRYGVEQSLKQSLVGCLADIYASQKNIALPTIAEMRDVLSKAITLDMFLKYNNGSLPSVFKTGSVRTKLGADVIGKYSGTDFYKSLDTANEAQYDFLEDTISAFENFLAFIRDENSTIDHTYLWDVVTTKNPALFDRGFNLVIFTIVNNDITDKVEILCPTNSYSKNHFSSLKDSILLLKHDNFYEPIYQYELKENKIIIKKSFHEDNIMKNVKKTFAAIKNSMNEYCSALPSMPKVYHFKKNITAEQLADVLQKASYSIGSQVMNYQAKIIGLTITKPTGEKSIFVPCFPSNQLDNFNTVSMESNVWQNYRMTRDELTHLSKKLKLPISPRFKLIENNMIVGLITDTNQFVQVFPPEENVEKDGIEEIQGTNLALADKALALRQESDPTRVTMIRNIALETKIYNSFRSTIRVLLNQFRNRNYKERIQKFINSDNITYLEKLKNVELLLRKLCKSSIQFVESVPVELLDEYLDVNVGKDRGQTELCLINEENDCKLIVPKIHLVSAVDNEKLYFGRMTDEFIRYQRIRSFMFEPKVYLNISSTNYKISADEFIILQSLLTNEYFENLVPYPSGKYITYDFSEPVDSQSYLNTNIYDMNKKGNLATAIDEEKTKCIKETRDVYGNSESYWKQLFPKTAKEVVLQKEPNCSFFLFGMILYERTSKYHSIQQIKQLLWDAYLPLWEDYSIKFEDILAKQGKVDFVRKLKGGIVDMETLVKSEEYYLTNLDIWILASKMNLPIVLYCEKPFKNMIVDIKWLVLSGSSDDSYYFVRSPIVIERNIVPVYQMVKPCLKFSEVRGFAGMVESGMRGEEEYKKSLISFDTFLREYSTR
uniref:Uncharacterized protein n=1 Tax=viral metagenome TaxID=1070528 RepID=A0A6C0B6W0_9ZZZZ